MLFCVDFFVDIFKVPLQGFEYMQVQSVFVMQVTSTKQNDVVGDTCSEYMFDMMQES